MATTVGLRVTEINDSLGTSVGHSLRSSGAVGHGLGQMQKSGCSVPAGTARCVRVTSSPFSSLAVAQDRGQ